jgi:ribosomal protein L12E/L44/L45/RPP1/RPP2
MSESLDKIKMEVEAARFEVVQAEKEISGIRLALRNLASTASASASAYTTSPQDSQQLQKRQDGKEDEKEDEENSNSLLLSVTKVCVNVCSRFLQKYYMGIIIMIVIMYCNTTTTCVGWYLCQTIQCTSSYIICSINMHGLHSLFQLQLSMLDLLQYTCTHLPTQHSPTLLQNTDYRTAKRSRTNPTHPTILSH